MHYVGIVNDETGEILFAEHYEDKAEAVKRSKQLEPEALVRGWKVYLDEKHRDGSVFCEPEIDDRKVINEQLN